MKLVILNSFVKLKINSNLFYGIIKNKNFVIIIKNKIKKLLTKIILLFLIN